MTTLCSLLLLGAAQAGDCALPTDTLIADIRLAAATRPRGVATKDLSPEEKAFLDMIAYAEDTHDNYNMQYGGSSFSGTQHPRRWIASPWGTPGVGSDAAGRYQFLSTSWDEAADAIGVSRNAFTPVNQDRAAIYLIQRNGADTYRHVLNSSSRVQFEAAVRNLSHVWASLPPQRYPGQNVHDMGELWKVYQEAYRRYGGR